MEHEERAESPSTSDTVRAPAEFTPEPERDEAVAPALVPPAAVNAPDQDSTITAAASESAPLPAASPPDRRRRMPSRQATVIGLLLVAVIVESVLLFRSGSEERARTEVFDIARRFLTTLTTYNTDTIDDQRKDVLSLATGRFRSEYTQLTGADFVAALRERQADSKGKVTRLAVTSIEGDNAEVMAVVEVSVTNKDLPAPKVERNVIELSLVRTGSGWRIDAVSILGTLP